MQKTITLTKTWDFNNDSLNQELTLNINNDDFITLVNVAIEKNCAIADFNNYQITEDPYCMYDDIQEYLEYDYKDFRVYNDYLEVIFRDKFNEELAIYEYKYKPEDFNQEPSLVKALKVIEFNIEADIKNSSDFELLFNASMQFCLMTTNLTYSPRKPVSKVFILKENINEFKNVISDNIEECFEDNKKDADTIKSIASQLSDINTDDIDMININIQWI